MNPQITLGLADFLGCGYYRCILPYYELSKHGAKVLITNNFEEADVRASDVLVLQRQHSKDIIEVIKFYKEEVPHGKVVFEFDDNFHAIPKSNPNSRVYHNGSPSTKNMEEMLRLSDLVTVSTEGLQAAYKRFNDNIHVCHNAVEPTAVAELNLCKPERAGASNLFRLGWAGSSTHDDDFATIVKPLTEILTERPNVQMVFIGHDMRSLFPFGLRRRMEYMGHTFPKDELGNSVNHARDDSNPTTDYYRLLKRANLDAAVAPLERYLFNSCKSYIKLIEYGIAEIPYVATRFGPYSSYTGSLPWSKREQAFGLTADTAKEWKSAMLEMIDNESLRKTLTSNNLKEVLTNHLVPQRIHEWKTAYASIGITFDGDGGEYKTKVDKRQRIA